MRRATAVLLLLLLAFACGRGTDREPATQRAVPTSEPASVLVLFPGECSFFGDCFAESARGSQLRAGMAGFLESVSKLSPSVGEIGVLDYGGYVELIAPIGPPKDLENATLRSRSEYGNAAGVWLQRGLLQAHQQLRDRPGRKVVVIVGDGQTMREEFGRDRVLGAIYPFYESRIELHAFALPAENRGNDEWDKLRNIADLGRYVEFESIGEGSAMAAELARILGEPSGEDPDAADAPLGELK